MILGSVISKSSGCASHAVFAGSLAPNPVDCSRQGFSPKTKMYLKSMYPDVPKIPSRNFHHLLFHHPDIRQWNDYTLFIDAATGRKSTYREFYERVMDGATALGSPISDQGLGLRGEDGEIVGILSENCVVRPLLEFYCIHVSQSPLPLPSFHPSPRYLSSLMPSAYLK